MVVPLQTPRASQQLTSEFAIKGGLKLLLDEVISGVIVLKDRSRKYAMGWGNLGVGGVGNRSEIALVNTFFPAADVDGTVHVHSIWVASSVAAAFNFTFPTVALAGFADLTTERFLDTVRQGTPQAALQEDNGSAQTAGIDFFRVLTGAAGVASRRTDFDPPIILSPNGARALIVKTESDNQSLEAMILWSEPPDPV